MTRDLRELVTPTACALVTQELQRGVVGDLSVLPELAAAAQPVVPNAARLVHRARAVGVPVFHCLAGRRADERGSNVNARLFAAMRRRTALHLGSPMADVVPELGVAPEDFVLSRIHGLGPMAGTELDAILRNLGVRTIVGVGVSVNVGITNFAMDAVNLGYQFVLPRDAVAGVPPEYGEAVLANTLALITTVVTTDDVLAAWG